MSPQPQPLDQGCHPNYVDGPILVKTSHLINLQQPTISLYRPLLSLNQLNLIFLNGEAQGSSPASRSSPLDRVQRIGLVQSLDKLPVIWEQYCKTFFRDY